MANLIDALHRPKMDTGVESLFWRLAARCYLPILTCDFKLKD